MIYNSFRDMPVWQKANKLAIEVFKLTINLPRSEDYGLTSQIRIYGNNVGYFETLITQQIDKEYDDLIFELNKIIKSLS
jgi:hypothetical protein